MKTNIVIKLFSNLSRVRVTNLVDSAFEEFARITQKYTRFSEQSELSRLNRNSGEWVEVDEEFIYLVENLLDLAKFSGGRFDPTIIDLLEINGYKSSFDRKKIVEEKVVISDMQSYLRKRPRWDQIEIDVEKASVKLMPSQRLDLGGIGKGYAIRLAADILSGEIEDFFIDAGGDTYGKGKNQEKEDFWSVELRSKLDTGLVSLGQVNIDITGMSLASSGSWARSVGSFHHLLNPSTGSPERESLQSFVLHKDPMIADALATVLFLVGESIIDEMVKKYSAESILIKSTGKVFSSENVPL